jgi:hypothetical protein
MYLESENPALSSNNIVITYVIIQLDKYMYVDKTGVGHAYCGELVERVASY